MLPKQQETTRRVDEKTKEKSSTIKKDSKSEHGKKHSVQNHQKMSHFSTLRLFLKFRA